MSLFAICRQQSHNRPTKHLCRQAICKCVCRTGIEAVIRGGVAGTACIQGAGTRFGIGIWRCARVAAAGTRRRLQASVMVVAGAFQVAGEDCTRHGGSRRTRDCLLPPPPPAAAAVRTSAGSELPPLALTRQAAIYGNHLELFNKSLQHGEQQAQHGGERAGFASFDCSSPRSCVLYVACVLDERGLGSCNLTLYVYCYLLQIKGPIETASGRRPRGTKDTRQRLRASRSEAVAVAVARGARESSTLHIRLARPLNLLSHVIRQGETFTN